MNPASNLILVGPMGAGKSTLATRLATRLGLRAIDLDHELVRRAGASVAAIFADEGEAGFRARESALLTELLADDGLVLSTGGGVVLDPANRAGLSARGFVVHLEVGVAAQLLRLADDTSRPLLARDDRESVLHALAQARAPLYAEVADLTIATDGLSADEVANRIVDALARHWQRPTQAPGAAA